MESMRRLPGRSSRNHGFTIQRHQLWLAETHLLYREISGFGEEVKRFYYTDIQAIICTPTKSFRFINVMAASVLVACATLAGWAAWRGYLVLFGLLWVVATLVLIVLLGNLVLGQTCGTTLYTATAEAPLFSLGRRRTAQRAIAMLAERIQVAQAEPAAAEHGRPAPAPENPSEALFSGEFGAAPLSSETGPRPSDL